MRIDKTYLGHKSPALECESVTDAIGHFRNCLSGVDLANQTAGPSQVIKRALESLTQRTGWEKKFLFSREAHSSLPNANYTVNYLFVEKSCNCGFRHKVFFHLCFDNRQAIGTHLLRFKLATYMNSKQPNDRPIAVAVVADSQAKSKFGWDNSAATYEEFVQALDLEYSEILDLNLNFLVIRA